MNTNTIKNTFTDIRNFIVFAFEMAIDVNKFLREENANETLCLELS